MAVQLRASGACSFFATVCAHGPHCFTRKKGMRGGSHSPMRWEEVHVVREKAFVRIGSCGLAVRAHRLARLPRSWSGRLSRVSRSVRSHVQCRGHQALPCEARASCTVLRTRWDA